MNYSNIACVLEYIATAFIIPIIVGLITGAVSSWFVYCRTKQQERVQEAFHFWLVYYFDAYKYCEMQLPQKDLLYKWVMNDNQEWKTATQKIQDYIQGKTFPESLDDKELSEDEIEFTDSLENAIGYLLQWAGKQEKCNSWRRSK